MAPWTEAALTPFRAGAIWVQIQCKGMDSVDAMHCILGFGGCLTTIYTVWKVPGAALNQWVQGSLAWPAGQASPWSVTVRKAHLIRWAFKFKGSPLRGWQRVRRGVSAVFIPSAKASTLNLRPLLPLRFFFVNRNDVFILLPRHGADENALFIDFVPAVLDYPDAVEVTFRPDVMVVNRFQ